MKHYALLPTDDSASRVADGPPLEYRVLFRTYATDGPFPTIPDDGVDLAVTLTYDPTRRCSDQAWTALTGYDQRDRQHRATGRSPNHAILKVLALQLGVDL